MWFLCPLYPRCPHHEQVEAERMCERGGQFLFTLTRACKIFPFSHMTLVIISGSWGMGQLAVPEEDKDWFRLDSLCSGHNTALFEKFLDRSQLLWDGTFIPDNKGTYSSHPIVSVGGVYLCIYFCVRACTRRGPRKISLVFFGHFPVYLLRQGFSLNIALLILLTDG